MSKGENIFKRKDGRWEARYIKGYDEAGRIRYGFCYGKTYKEAKEKVAPYKAAVIGSGDAGCPSARQPITFFCEGWLEMKRGQVKESTYSKYETIIRLHIRPVLGRRRIQELTLERIRHFREDLQRNLASKTVHDILMVLHCVLQYASEQFPQSVPMIRMTYPRVERKEMRVLTREEQQRLVAYLSENMDTCKFGILLALFTGLRIGELCALRWENVSLTEETICVRATVQRLQERDRTQERRTKIVFGSPKSDTSFRTIPLTDAAAALCRHMNPQNPHAFILTGTETFMEPRTLQYRIKNYMKACRLEGVHCHTLRHTFATRAVEVGFELKSLSEILGHATPAITLNRYVHASMELKRDNMNKLSAVGF